MLHRIISAILSTFVLLSAQPSFSHESEHHSLTAEILEELRALREDLGFLDNSIGGDDTQGPIMHGSGTYWLYNVYQNGGQVGTLRLTHGGTTIKGGTTTSPNLLVFMWVRTTGSWENEQDGCFGSGVIFVDAETGNFVACRSGFQGQVYGESSPSSGDFQHPLWVGLQWGSTFDWRDHRNPLSSGEIVINRRVVSRQSVPIDAGEVFESFCVEVTSGSFYAPHSGFHRFPASFANDYCYAPDIGSVVTRYVNDGFRYSAYFNLVEYRLVAP